METWGGKREGAGRRGDGIERRAVACRVPVIVAQALETEADDMGVKVSDMVLAALKTARPDLPWPAKEGD